MTKFSAIFLSVFYAPIGFYLLYKASGIAEPVPDDTGNSVWILLGIMSLLIAGMSVFYLIRSARPADEPANNS